MWETDVTDQTASDQLRVVIADDASAMRALLRRMLEDSTAFEIVGEAADGEEAVSLAGALHPDVVLLDVAMPGMDGLEAIPGIRRMSPTTRIVVLSAIEASRVKAQALASGADAFIEKRMVSDSLALRLVEACRMPRLHPGDETGHETGTAADCIVGLAASEHPAVQPYRELAWFRVAFEHAPIGIALVELDGRIETVNEAFCRIVGHSSEQLVGTGVHRISHPGDVVRHAGLRDHMLRALPNYQAEPTYQAEHRFVRADGQVAWTLVTCSLLKAGEGTPSRFVWQVVDISERKSAEAATVRFDELRERYEKELAHSNADLAQLAAVAAHDLKSPLQVISGFAALLEQTQADVLDERGQEFLGFILKSATRMNTLIDDLLAYARVGTDRRPYVVVPLDRVMEEVRAVLSAQTQATGGSVESEPLPVVTGDPAYFVHVLQDLVANGLKFVAEGTTPRVTVSASRMVNAWCIDVVDNGIGIDSQHRTHVFGMFHRLHRNEYEGTGIGLAICKRLVEQRGGSIWVESNPQGAREQCRRRPRIGP